MNIAYMMASGRGDTDLILFGLANRLRARGLQCRGTVQINTEHPGDGPCDMDVRVLPDGPVLRISQDLGRASQGCRLDPAALETAVGLVAASLEGGGDVVIVNKFGKHEAEGHGFREVIAMALAMDIPVIVGLNAANRPAFEAFTDGLATEVAADEAALVAWLDAVRGRVPA